MHDTAVSAQAPDAVLAEPRDGATTTKINGATLRLLRERKGLNGRQFTALTGIGNATLSKIENGARAGSRRTQLLIADALGVDLSEITYTVPSTRARRRSA